MGGFIVSKVIIEPTQKNSGGGNGQHSMDVAICKLLEGGERLIG